MQPNDDALRVKRGCDETGTAAKAWDSPQVSKASAASARQSVRTGRPGCPGAQRRGKSGLKKDEVGLHGLLPRSWCAGNFFSSVGFREIGFSP